MFNISVIASGDDSFAECEIIIGDHKERVPLITTFWSSNQYESQWREALHNLVLGVVDKCILIIDIQPLNISAGINFWVLFREDEIVYFQERILFSRPSDLIGASKVAEMLIDPRIQGTPEEQAEVSEWQLPFEELKYSVLG